LVVTLIVGVYYFLVHVPTMGVSSRFFSTLVAQASKPVFGQEQPKPPDISAEHAQQSQKQRYARLSSKRRRGRGNHLQQQPLPQQTTVTAVSVGSALSRGILFAVLCLLSSCSTAAAMQVSSSLLGDLSASLQRMQLQAPAAAPCAHLSRQQAMQLLGWELGSLPGCRFRCCRSAVRR
jgi:hypothetical protein